MKNVLVMLDPLSLPRLEAILAHARDHDWAVILEDRLPTGSLDRIDGALVSLRGRADHVSKVKTLKKRGKPVVDLTIACPRTRLPRVVSDHKALGALAAQHFIERGFANFAWYASGRSHVHDLRRQGYAETLRQKGFSFRQITTPSLQLPTLPRPLAVLAFDESDAAHVIDACRRLKMEIPGDVAILGIGNDPFLCENGNVTISSVDQGLGLAARKACDLLDCLMSGQSRRSKGQTILIPPVGIIPRKSTDTLAHPDPTIRAALVFIHQNLHKAFGAAQTAAAVGIPRSTLDHLFAEKIGHSIGSEILNQRLLRAKRILKGSAVHLKEIAAICGFCNSSYFTNVFRAATGMTPKAWRAATRPSP